LTARYTICPPYMAEPDRVQAVLDAAEGAAAAKDFTAAERLLREAIQLQEADLGPDHPDLANTLNNLGVLCEMAGRPTEAEGCYRRAYEIAAATLPSDHPYVTTSRDNLTEFCTARGKPLDLPLPVRPAPSAAPLEPPQTEPPLAAELSPAVEPAPIVATPQVVPIPPVVEAPAAVPSPRNNPPAAGSFGISTPLAIAVVALVVLLLVVFVLRTSDPGGSAPDTVTSTNAVPSPPERPAAPETSASPAPPPPAASTADPKPSSSTPVPAVPAPGGNKPERGASANRGAPPGLVVATALLCQRFAPRGSPDWQCDPARGPVSRGTLVFYTRIRSARPVAVQHRWYRGEVLHQSVSLDVSANQVAGYRTYSRYTVPQSGSWRVELRTRDGALLHEERFEVR
jgi:hypothetical protein